MEESTPNTVLVTGGTGYLAGWVIAALLQRGYRVRTTVRDIGKASRVRSSVAHEVGDAAAAKLDVVQADLLDDAGWDDALRDVDYVLHTASPMPFDTEADLVATAREGTRRVLTAAAAAGVRRVVFTSSGLTATPDDPTEIATEELRSAPKGGVAHAYPDSKILAERDAWEVASASGLDVCAVLPMFMLGPSVGAPERSGTVDVVRRLVEGKLPALPNVGWNVVDVRDVAELHVLAMTSDAASGERFLAAGKFLWYRDIAGILQNGLGSDGRKIPSRRLPDFVVGLMARVNSDIAAIRPELGITRLGDSSKAHRLLKWEQRDVECTVLDTGSSLISHSRRSAAGVA